MLKKYLIELDVNGGEWLDSMTVVCEKFESNLYDSIKADNVIIRIPSMCKIISYEEVYALN